MTAEKLENYKDTQKKFNEAMSTLEGELDSCTFHDGCKIAMDAAKQALTHLKLQTSTFNAPYEATDETYRLINSLKETAIKKHEEMDFRLEELRKVIVAWLPGQTNLRILPNNSPVNYEHLQTQNNAMHALDNLNKDIKTLQESYQRLVVAPSAKLQQPQQPQPQPQPQPQRASAATSMKTNPGSATNHNPPNASPLPASQQTSPTAFMPPRTTLFTLPEQNNSQQPVPVAEKIAERREVLAIALAFAVNIAIADKMPTGLENMVEDARDYYLALGGDEATLKAGIAKKAEEPGASGNFTGAAKEEAPISVLN